VPRPKFGFRTRDQRPQGQVYFATQKFNGAIFVFCGNFALRRFGHNGMNKKEKRRGAAFPRFFNRE